MFVRARYSIQGVTLQLKSKYYWSQGLTVGLLHPRVLPLESMRPWSCVMGRRDLEGRECSEPL